MVYQWANRKRESGQKQVLIDSIALEEYSDTGIVFNANGMTKSLYNPDPIAAIATAPGRGGVGVIRISGKSLAIFQEICNGFPPPRVAKFVSFRSSLGDIIDQGLVLYFPAPHSFTGEDVLELHGHGGTGVMQSLLKRCLELGARMAEPGEFTKRAFLNGKIDLAQAEAIADLIEASSSAAVRSAARSLSGEFSKKIHTAVDLLIHIRMLIEAGLDFPEEEIDFIDREAITSQLEAITSQLTDIVRQSQNSSILRDGLTVVLVGQPNVGKSSLLNQLAGEDLAIVTDVPGTTRDSVVKEISIDGIPIHVVDTAGLRETNDVVEKIGIEKTWQAIQKADVALLIIDITKGQTISDDEILNKLPSSLPIIKVLNKCDLLSEPTQQDMDALAISAKTGFGVGELRQKLLTSAGWESSEGGNFLARERHLKALTDALLYIKNIRLDSQTLELVAEELRSAQNALASITGEFSADDLLGEIFSKFCIGK